MPEEKEEKKATPFFGPSKQEGKKKESFTFSDKIKNSKPASSKSFAKHASSKIGSDGKPHQTLFERTKRDAPFFIAALVALLLLPFLYKYSGNVDEEPTMVTPAYDDSAFNPDRSGFGGFDGNPEGQLAQLAGRDPLAMIRPFGDAVVEETEVEDDGFSGAYAGEGSSERHQLDEQDEEENTTNIYKYRKRAPVATRAAIKRVPTKIGRLAGAGRAGANGGKLGVGMWGGSLKSAANKVRGKEQPSAPKPVSLQPLQAAGKPSRSYFGQGAAREAARSKDAMSKSNPMQALMDAQMKPVEPGKIGGILAGDFGGPGGGNGDLKREFLYTGKEPWWWDMMKQRAMMEWQRKFEYKWGWIDWATNFVRNILGGLLNCLITGKDDGGMGHMFGYGSGGGNDPTCCGVSEAKAASKKEIEEAGGFEAWCKVKTNQAKLKQLGYNCSTSWKGGDAPGASAGGWRARLECLGINGGRFRYAGGKPDMKEESDCEQLDQNNYYSVRVEGEARKWHTYHYIVARNYVPLAASKSGRHDLRLCSEYSNNFRWQKASSAGVAAATGMSTEQQQKLTEAENRLRAAREAKAALLEDNPKADTKEEDAKIKAAEKSVNELKAQLGKDAYTSAQMTGRGRKNNNLNQWREDYANPEALKDACVIYVAESTILNWEKGFKPTTQELLRELIKKEGIAKDEKEVNRLAEEAFNDLDLMFIASMSSKQPLSKRGARLETLPMPYWQFNEAYLVHRGTTGRDRDEGGYHTNVSKRKVRDEGVNVLYGAKCFFDNSIKLACKQNSNPAKAEVTFTKAFQGGHGAHSASAVTVKAAFTAGNGVAADGNPTDRTAMAQEVHATGDGVKVGENTVFEYQYDRMLGQTDAQGKATRLGATKSAQDVIGVVQWMLYRGGELIKTVSCEYNNSGDGFTPVVDPKECPHGANTSKECCDKHHPQNWKAWEYKGGECVEKIIPDANPNPNPEPEPGTLPEVYFAPVISWVPNGVADRSPKKEAGERLTKAHFPTTNRYIPAAEQDEQKEPYQHCGDQEPLMMDSQLAKDFVMQVADKYNEQPDVKSGKKNPISKELKNNYPTDGEFIDALQIADKLGIAEVPAAAVCELARDYVRMSRDLHVGDRLAYDEKDFKGLHRYYRNELGAFLAYVHETSVLYPNRWYDKTVGKCDWRFIPVGAVCGKASDVKMGKAYYYNKYNDSRNNNAKLSNYTASLDKVGIGQEYPLQALVKGKKELPHNCPTDKCHEERKNYEPTYAGLLHDAQNSGGNGQACEGFVGQAKMSVKDALKYAKQACTVGLNAKPYGGGASEVAYKQGQTFTQSGSSGNASTGPVQSNN